jgi:pilus assembly protein CpaB
MNRKRLGIVLVVLGLLLALGVGVLVYVTAEQAAEIDRRTPTVDVVIATADLPERVAIPASAVTITKVPAGLLPIEASTKLENVVGKYPLTRIFKNEVLVQSKLADTTGRTGPSFALKDGMVAASLSGNDVLSGTGAIRPGDRVDILLTLPLTRTAAPGQPSTGQAQTASSPIPQVTQTLVQNIEVLRVGSFPTGSQQQDAAAGSKAITFQVDRQNALILKWAKDSGGVIDIALRAPSDKEDMATESITANYVIKKFKFAFAEPLQ